jgi:hypothetical protein
MKSFDKLVLVASLLLAAYAAYTLAAGLFSGTLCYQFRCAHRGHPGESFLGYAFMYGLAVAFGLVSAWRSRKNFRTVWARAAPNGRSSLKRRDSESDRP